MTAIHNNKACFALIFTPHPDDAEFGIGGTVALWTQKGQKVIYIVCTNGDKGSEDPDMSPQQLVAMRKVEQLGAAKILGVSEVIFLPHRDQSLEDTAEFREEIVRMIRLYRPKIVAAPDIYSPKILHRDHRIVGQVVLDAVYPFARNRLAYPDMIQEGLYPHIVKEILLWGGVQPDYYINISDTYEQKLTALKCHQSQVGQFNGEHLSSFRQRHEEMAKGKGYQLAEAFRRIVIEW